MFPSDKEEGVAANTRETPVAAPAAARAKPDAVFKKFLRSIECDLLVVCQMLLEEALYPVERNLVEIVVQIHVVGSGDNQ